MARPQPPQQPPPVQRLRIRYAKRGPARFASHRDFSRAFERALRRANVPMAYSSGFHPHPRISFANASPTSAATEAEYVEIGLAQVCDPAAVRDALNDAMPPGMPVLDVVEATPGTSLGELLTASTWRLECRGADADVLARALDALLAAPTLVVERETRKGTRRIDVREPLLRASASGTSIDLLLRHTTPLVRPDDVASALASLEPSLSGTFLVTRLVQGTLAADGSLVDPLGTA